MSIRMGVCTGLRDNACHRTGSLVPKIRSGDV